MALHQSHSLQDLGFEKDLRSPSIYRLERPLDTLVGVTERVDAVLASDGTGFVQGLHGWVVLDDSFEDNTIFVPNSALKPHIHENGVLLHGLYKPRPEATLIYCQDGTVIRHSWAEHREFNEKSTIVPWLFLPKGVSHTREDLGKKRMSVIGSLIRSETGEWDFSSE
ncbi:MAG: hypothetical protein ACI9QC_000514 [Oceanicoccus sp.]|jgi:hypothetical protein